MSFLSSIEAQALVSALEEDSDFEVRRILRWYSKTFHTPLHEVEDLPSGEVFRAYFEDSIADMHREQLLEQARLLLETPEDRLARLAAEAEGTSADQEFMASWTAKLQADLLKEQAKKRGVGTKIIAKVPEDRKLLKPEDAQAVPPDIKMSFDEDGGLRDPTDTELEDPFAPRPAPKKL